MNQPAPKRFSDLLEANCKAGEQRIREWWAAYLAAQTAGHPDYFTPTVDEPDRHYDRNGYCDNPSRGY